MYKIYDCFKASDEIVKHYREIIENVSSFNEDNPKYLEKMNKIKDLIVNEDKLYDNLRYKDIIYSIELLEKTDEDKYTEEQVRIYNRLRAAFRTTFCNYFRVCKILPFDVGVFSDMKVESWDVIYSMIELETLSKVEEKIHSINKSDEMAEKFVNDLLMEHNKCKIIALSRNKISEAIMVSYGCDFSSLPVIDYKKISEMTMSHDDAYDKGLSDSIMIDLIEDVLKKLSILDVEEINDAAIYYQHVYYLSILDVYLSYLDEEELMALGDIHADIKKAKARVRSKCKY